jgi:hypothetical protein
MPLNGRKALSTTIPLVTAFPSKWLMILLQRAGLVVLSTTKEERRSGRIKH